MANRLAEGIQTTKWQEKTKKVGDSGGTSEGTNKVTTPQHNKREEPRKDQGENQVGGEKVIQGGTK